MITLGMRASSLVLATSLLALAACGSEAGGPADEAAPAAAASTATPVPLELKAADGVTVHATRYPAERARAVVLLFHQANGSAAEYKAIAPRLAALGYEVLATDQRSGGDLFGPNRTVNANGRSSDFLSAEPDLDAALAWARQRELPVIVWGSSYSAALVFRLAARHPGDIAALVAFSPGEYLGRPDAVRSAARQLSLPIFAAAASDPEEQAALRTIVDAAPSQTETAYLPSTGGIHGSSTLDASRNPTGADAAWISVTEFLKQLPPKEPTSAP
jgi:dienelactone hydrolase